MTDSDDRVLLLRVQRGESAAFNPIVQRYQTTVFSVCWRLLGERNAAEDATQEVFIRAYERLHTFDINRPFGPWIRRVAANLCFNLLSATGQHTESEWREDLLHAGAVQVRIDHDDPLRVLLRNEQADRVRSAILALPPHFRIAIELRHFQELNYDEIGSELHCSLSTVKTHLFRARRMLADLLQQEGKNEEILPH